jgi:hypothetical protein
MFDGNEKFERVLFLVIVVVFLLDVFYWRT